MTTTPSPATIPHAAKLTTQPVSTPSRSPRKAKDSDRSPKTFERPEHLTQNLKNHAKLEELKNSLPQPKKLDYTPKPRKNRRVTVSKPQ